MSSAPAGLAHMLHGLLCMSSFVSVCAWTALLQPLTACPPLTCPDALPAALCHRLCCVQDPRLASKNNMQCKDKFRNLCLTIIQGRPERGLTLPWQLKDRVRALIEQENIKVGFLGGNSYSSGGGRHHHHHHHHHGATHHQQLQAQAAAAAAAAAAQPLDAAAAAALYSATGLAAQPGASAAGSAAASPSASAAASGQAAQQQMLAQQMAAYAAGAYVGGHGEGGGVS